MLAIFSPKKLIYSNKNKYLREIRRAKSEERESTDLTTQLNYS